MPVGSQLLTDLAASFSGVFFDIQAIWLLIVGSEVHRFCCL